MDKTTNNDLQEGYRQYNEQNYKQRSRGRLQTIQWTKLQPTISRKDTDNTMDKTTNNVNRGRLQTIQWTKLQTTSIEEGYRHYNEQSYKQLSRGRLQTIQWTKLQTTVNRGRLQTIQWTKLQTTISRKVTDNTMDKTTNNDLQEGYRQYNGQHYKQP